MGIMQEQIQQFIENFQQDILVAERLPVAMAALVIVTLIGLVRGGAGGLAVPLFWRMIDKIFGKLGARMNKAGRPMGDLIFRGFVLSVLAVVMSFVIGRGLNVISFTYPTWSVVEILSLSLLLSAGAGLSALGRLYRALNTKKLGQGAYYSIARSTQTNLSKSDDYTITRVGMGLAMKSFDKAVVAPIFWYVLLGLPAAFIFAGLTALSWRFGRDGHAGGFGKGIYALEEIMGFIPNLLSGLLVALAGILTPTAGMTRAFLGLFKFQGRARYGEGGTPMTAAAYALRVSLGGPTQDLEGHSVKRGWIGPLKATAQLEAKHLHRMIYLSVMAHLLFLMTLSAVMILVNS